MKVDPSGALPRPAAGRLLFAQLVAGLVPVLFLVPMGMMLQASSAVYGALLAVVPNWIFARWAFRHGGARQAQRVMADFYTGEMLKFFATAIGFSAVFVLVKPLAAGWLFASYLLALAVYWFAPGLLSRQLNG